MLLFDRETFSRHIPWIVGVACATAAAMVWYALEARQATRWPGGSSRVGLCLGAAAAGLILFEFLLWPRKALRSWRWLGSARAWMRAHIWLGLLSIPWAWLHTGFSWGGTLTTLLAWLFIVVIASGVVGLALQQWLPRILTRSVPLETIASHIDDVNAQTAVLANELVRAACGLTAEPHAPPRTDPGEASRDAGRSPLSGARSSHALVVGAVRSSSALHARLLQEITPDPPLRDPKRLRQAFASHIQPYLEQGRKSGSPLRYRDAAATYFRELRAGSEEAAGPLIDALETWCEQRRQLELQQRLHAWLHVWLAVHLPISAALMLVLGAHIVTALKYR